MNRLNVLKKYSMNLKNYTDKFQFAEIVITRKYDILGSLLGNITL